MHVCTIKVGGSTPSLVKLKALREAYVEYLEKDPHLFYSSLKARNSRLVS